MVASKMFNFITKMWDSARHSFSSICSAMRPPSATPLALKVRFVTVHPLLFASHAESRHSRTDSVAMVTWLCDLPTVYSLGIERGRIVTGLGPRDGRALRKRTA